MLESSSLKIPSVLSYKRIRPGVSEGFHSTPAVQAGGSGETPGINSFCEQKADAGRLQIHFPPHSRAGRAIAIVVRRFLPRR